MELHLTVDRSLRVPLALQVAHGIRDAIFTQRLSPGTRLPPTRELSQRLGLSRMVVVEAYEWLAAEGYLESRTGSGSYISKTVMWLIAPPAPVPDPPRRTDELPSRNVLFNFRPGLPALDRFPREAWNRALSRAVFKADVEQLGYGPVEGLPRLRRVIAEYIARTRGLPVAPERVVITVGAAQAVDLMLRSLTPISKLAIEEPGPEPVRRVLQLHGIRPLPIPVDEQGLRVESLPDNESAPKVVHVIPSHQYPTGWAMSLERRAKLLAWADAHDSAVIEDDYDSEFRYDRSPPIALAALDRSQRVIYIGSFSKTMFPGLRLGFCIVPERFIGRFLDLKWFSDRCVPIFEQLALAEWIESGTLEQHIRKMRKIYAQRRNALLSALNLHFGKTVRVLGVPAGMHMMLDLDLKLSEVEVMERAISRGIKLYPASPCFIAPRSQGSSLIIGFGHLSSERIAVGVHRLAGALGREIKR